MAKRDDTPVARGEGLALQHDIAKGRRAVHKLLHAAPEALRSRDFLLECICEFGIHHNDWGGFHDFKGILNASRFGIAQIPSEFADYLILTAHYELASYLEVGTLYGGTAVLAAAVLSRLNPGFRLTCIDIENHFLDYDYYSALLPIRLVCPATSADFIGQGYDVVFIDADHSYHGALKDYLQVGRFAGLCAFHDIKGHEYDHLHGGPVRLWGEVKNYARKTHTILEISHSSPDWMGIGVVIEPGGKRAALRGEERPERSAA
jgi:hypothetical protein